MALASKVYKRPGSSMWIVRQVVPPDVRHLVPPPYDRRISLRTADEALARRRALPLIEALETEIMSAREIASAPRLGAFDVSTAIEAINAWLVRIKLGHHSDWWRNVEQGAPSPEMLRRMTDPCEAIPDCGELLAEMLTESGLEPPRRDFHFYLARPMWRAFGLAYAEAIEFQVRAAGAANPMTETQREQLAIISGVAKAPSQRLISQVLEDWIAADRPREERQARNYVRRLIEQIGDKAIGDVTKMDMTGMLVALRQFPVLKSGRVKDSMSFGEILAQFEDDLDSDGEPVARIIGATIRKKWFATYRQLFSFAVEHDLIPSSPVRMPKPSDDGSRVRRPFTAGEIASLFSTPLFTGHNGATSGYLTEPGSVVSRDARYWLPIIALTTGMRLAEIGDALTEDVRVVDGVEVFDLTYRTLKTGQSQRFVPVSDLLMDRFGFRRYVEARREAGNERLFDVSTVQWGKWWGLWMTENGFDDPELSFHSFRHTFKLAANDSGEKYPAEFIMGHVGGNAVADSYGTGRVIPRVSDGKAMSLTARAKAIEKIALPALPLLRMA